MTKKFRVRLVARNEGVEYQDETGIYRFNVSLNDRRWTLFLPGSRGGSYESHLMDEAERSRILPRVIEFLEHVRWFGLFRRSYSVRIDERPAPSITP
jgi:hypothetical protein